MTIAAPNFFTSGSTLWNFSSPSSKLIELMMLLPRQYVSARSIDLSIRRIDHERHFDLVNHLLVKAVDVAQLIAVGIFEVDVDDMRAALDLRPRDLASLPRISPP